MKVPEAFFVIINPVMRALLRSRLHTLFGSDSLMLITFTGRNSGRRFTIPVRYLRIDGGIRCFTEMRAQWWRNLRGGAEVSLLITGREARFLATPLLGDISAIRAALKHYLALFPADAAYQNICLNRDGTLVTDDLERACHTAVVVECRPLNQPGDPR